MDTGVWDIQRATIGELEVVIGTNVLRNGAILAAGTGIYALAGANLPGAAGETVREINTLFEQQPFSLFVAYGAGKLAQGRGGPTTGLRAIPERAALAGAAMLGYMAGKAADRFIHRDWQHAAERSAGNTEAQARGWFVDHGVDGSLAQPTPIKVSRTNAQGSYRPARFLVMPERIELGSKYFDDNAQAAQDVIFHEYSHRVIGHYTNGMQGRGTGTAIGEALADTFACVLDNDWTIGEDSGKVIRSLQDPASIDSGKGPYPTNRSQIDESGVLGTRYGASEPHWASTVASHVSYVIGSQLGRETLGELYLNVLKQHMLDTDSNFADLARAASASAEQLWGSNSHESQVVRKAWADAGYTEGLQT